MMTKYCFLCLSDEGVFLNITPYNYKSLCGEVESYLPVKIEGTRGKQNKVCYKCAYELKQCSDFVRKYKESRTNVEQKLYRKQCCNLCLEPAKKGYIFKIKRDNDSLNNLWSTIEKLFDGNLPEFHKSPLICLTCRYILDILLDLTCLCQEMSKLKGKLNEDIDYSEIPKVNTAVIKRKTTATKFMRLKTHVLDDSDSDSSVSKNQLTAEMNKDPSQKLRLCDQCKNSIKHGEDMYRLHRSGLTVCKTCRGRSMDLNKHSKKKSEPSTTNTKLCTVFLKDVLSDTSVKQQKAYKVEEDSYGNKIYVITESESEIESDDKVKVSKESEKIQETIQTRSKSRTNSDSSDNKTRKKKEIKNAKQNEPASEPSKKRTPANYNHYSDTDILLKKSHQNSETRAVKRRNTSISSVSDVDPERKTSRKKLRSILEHFRPSKDSDISDDTSINEYSTKEKDTNEKNTNEKNTNENERKRKTRSSSVSSTNESECSAKIKDSKRTKLSKTSPKISNSPKKSLSDGMDLDKNVDTNEKYTCSKCCAVHENKLIAATHELTHLKQLELKLHKIHISDKLEDEQQVDGSSERQLIDELAEQQNEEITLTVNDDEDIEMASITEDTNKQHDEKICPSATANEEENSLKMHVSNKECIEETEVVDKTTEPIHEESKKSDDHEVKSSETTEQNLLISTSMTNKSSCLDDIKNDQIQNGNFESDEVENEQKKINKLTIDKDKTSENENMQNTESENIELNLDVMDEDESNENENADNTENESIKLQQNKSEEIGDDITNKAEKDKIEETDSKIEETEKDKIETITRGQNEQNGDKNVPDDLEDFSPDNAKLNDTVNIDEVQSDNFSQEKQRSAANDDNDNNKEKTNINTVDCSTLEDCTENSVPTCNIKSKIDNCHPTEEEIKQVNETSTSHVEKESKSTGDTKSLPSNLEDTNSIESTKNNEVVEKEKGDQESANRETEIVENMFGLATDEPSNHEDVTNQNKKDNEMEAETLEDISREIQKSADMPSLEPISSMEVDHKKLV